jgi:hypothetical protein
MSLSSALVASSAARSQIDLPLRVQKFTPCVAIRRRLALGLLFGRVAMFPTQAASREYFLNSVLLWFFI